MTTTIDTSQNIVKGGFFLMKNVHPLPCEWPMDNMEEQHFLGTYVDSGAPIRDALMEMFKGARKRIFVTSFLLGDEQIISELIEAATRLQGGVYVITALNDKSLRQGLRYYEMNDAETPKEQKKHYRDLTSCGVYVRGHSSCHAKFAIIDDTIALAGSANFVSNAFDFINEACILLRNPRQVLQLKRLFTALWYSGCEWEIPPGKSYSVSNRAKEDPPMRPDAPTGRPGEVVWTNGPAETYLLQAIQNTILSAEDQLTLATYSIEMMSKKSDLLMTSIYQALEKNVSTRIFVRQRNAWPSQMSELLALYDAGVSIFGDTRNHAKAVVADNRRGILFSANFDGNSGLDTGVEIGVVLHEEPTKHLDQYLEHCIINANTEFVRDPTLAQLDERLAGNWRTTWTASKPLLIRCARDTAERFTNACKSGPVLYEKHNDEIHVFADEIVMSIHANDSERVCELSTPDENTTAEDRLKEWQMSVRGQSRSTLSLKNRCFFAGKIAFLDVDE